MKYLMDLAEKYRIEVMKILDHVVDGEWDDLIDIGFEDEEIDTLKSAIRSGVEGLDDFDFQELLRRMAEKYDVTVEFLEDCVKESKIEDLQEAGLSEDEIQKLRSLHSAESSDNHNLKLLI